MKKQSRREFIKVVSLSGGGLVLAAFIPAESIFAKPGEEPKIFSPNAFLKIDSNGVVTIIVHRSEMGQGVQTSLPMLVAEELEVDWTQIKIEQADADRKYGSQTTGGSTSIRRNYEPLRAAGAAAREMLIAAAAAKWKVQPADCKAENGFVINKLNGKKIGYGKLADDASKLPVPQNVKLKEPKDFKIIGKKIHRLDTPDKIYGKAKFGIDIVIPGMYYAAVKRPPVFGGMVKNFDASKTKLLNGVKEAVKISSGVAVIANSTWAAFKGKEELLVDWDNGLYANFSSEKIKSKMIEKLNGTGEEIRKEGNPELPITNNAQFLEATFEVPFLAHAPMEPMNCVANVKDGKAELWVATQNPQAAQRDIARQLGLKEENVTIHVTLLGGGFGRRLQTDFAVEAAEISKAAGVPVKLTWSREDDIKHGFYRPPSMHKLNGAIDSDGNLIKFEHHVSAPSIFSQRAGRKIEPKEYDIAEAAWPLEYKIPNIKLSGSLVDTHVPLGYWRAVYQTQNPFAVESFIDELAYLAKKDPFEFRRTMLTEDSRLRKVLELAAEKSDWYKKLEAGKGRGIALSEGFGSFCAQVAEVSIKSQNEFKIDRFICAIDCGIVINPDTVEAQIEGAIAFALSAALKGEITIKNGGVAESNFDDYPILTFEEMPKVEVYIAQNSFPVGGVGEVGMAACPPALCNAIFAAAGKRIRKLPVKLN